MERAFIPRGFRFHPTDVELVMYYLNKKILGKRLRDEVIGELNIYEFDPWDLPDKSCLKNKDLQWYFFCPMRKKYASGSRTNRATQTGFWKATGKERFVVHDQRIVGTIRTLVFHLGHAPLGERTNWILHEYRLEDKKLADDGVVQDAYVLCKVFQKSALGPNNGAQYGAPFNEEDWNDDAESLLSDGPAALFLPDNHKNSDVMITSVPKSTPTWPGYEIGSSSVVFCSDVQDNDFGSLLPSFIEDNSSIENGNNILSYSQIGPSSTMSLSDFQNDGNYKNSDVMVTSVPKSTPTWPGYEIGPSSVVSSSDVQDNDFGSLLPSFIEDTSSIENGNNILSYSQIGPSSAMPLLDFQNDGNYKNSVVMATSVSESTLTWPCCEIGSSSVVPSSDVQDDDFGEDNPPIENGNNILSYYQIGPSSAMSPSDFQNDGNYKNSDVRVTSVPESTPTWSCCEIGPSLVVPPSDVQDNDFVSLFDVFIEDNPPIENDNNILSYFQISPPSVMSLSDFQDGGSPFIENNNNILPYSQVDPSSVVPLSDVQDDDDVALL